MRLYRITAIFIMATLAIGCAPKIKPVDKVEQTPKPTITKTKPITAKKSMPKNPITVSLYSGKNKPKKPYVVVGKETVSRFNTAGTKRQEASIKDTLRKLASTLGGDAVIDIASDSEKVTGTVVTYEKRYS